jgi:hypothetical protein
MRRGCSGWNPQWPAGEPLQTHTAWAVALWRPAEAVSSAPLWGVCDGASAVAVVGAPCLHPAPGPRRMARLTRLRVEARGYAPVGSRARPQGRRPTWGERLAAPPPHVYGSTSWRAGRAWVYGRRRTCRDQHRRCRWAVSGPQTPVRVVVVAVPGSRVPWLVGTTALELSAAQVVAAFAARVRQEDGCRDHTHRLGREACRAWTKAPGWRTFQGPRVALTRLRLRQSRLEQSRGREHWWSQPAWSAQTRHGSIRELCRLFWRHQAAFALLFMTLEASAKLGHALAPQGNAVTRAA